MIVAINRQIDDGVNGGANGGTNGGTSGGANGGVNDGVNDGANDGANDGVNDGARKEIIALVTVIMDKEGLKAIDIAAKRGKSKPTIERYLKLARQFGLIEFRGPTKTGGYYITKSIRDNIENN